MAGADAVPARKRSRPRRIALGFLLSLWFLLLLTPCAFLYLAANGEIRINHSDIPEPHAHPRLLLSLISEIQDRGLRIESSTIQPQRADGLHCVETQVRFVLWQTRSENQDTRYCDCYTRVAGGWSLHSSNTDSCVTAAS